jgi:hypothetical protein
MHRESGRVLLLRLSWRLWSDGVFLEPRIELAPVEAYEPSPETHVRHAALRHERVQGTELQIEVS